ncbi:MAG: helix-turn-helix domain-containing protein [Acidimicrobiaceae bacterium]|nr:helix-turn-helix domain-containing protein [Candidatus Poribacteria bacterium]MYI34873.1 helix-turn-helix domain-containing protein [Acidimicrobiaceae bacterium]
MTAEEKIKVWLNDITTPRHAWRDYTYSRIAEEVGIHLSTLYDLLPKVVAEAKRETPEWVLRARAASAFERRDGSRRISPLRIAQIERLHDEGWTNVRIAHITNIGRKTVNRIVKEIKEGKKKKE